MKDILSEDLHEFLSTKCTDDGSGTLLDRLFDATRGNVGSLKYVKLEHFDPLPELLAKRFVAELTNEPKGPATPSQYPFNFPFVLRDVWFVVVDGSRGRKSEQTWDQHVL